MGEFYVKVNGVKDNMNWSKHYDVYSQIRRWLIMAATIGITFLALELIGVFVLTAVTPD